LKEDDKSRNLINLASSEINKELLVNPNSNILLISFYISDVHQKDDTDIHNEISLLINKPVQIVSEIISPFTVIELMKSSQKVYSQRLHSMILAYVSGVNFVAIPYQDKCIELLEQMGHKNILDFKY
jgi:polysaccharide pyruvyl transferase WcaK-like protein